MYRYDRNAAAKKTYVPVGAGQAGWGSVSVWGEDGKVHLKYRDSFPMSPDEARKLAAALNKHADEAGKG